MYNIKELDNGLRIIQRPSKGDVIYCGFAIKAGTRDERDGEEGLHTSVNMRPSKEPFAGVLGKS